MIQQDDAAMRISVTIIHFLANSSTHTSSTPTPARPCRHHHHHDPLVLIFIVLIVPRRENSLAGTTWWAPGVVWYLCLLIIACPLWNVSSQQKESLFCNIFVDLLSSSISGRLIPDRRAV